jgi:hypothetical protein
MKTTLLVLILAASGAAAADFDRFLSYWPGTYDNLAQVAAQEVAGRPADDRNQATVLHIAKVDLPAFGPYAYYAEWQDARQPARVIRQRIYAFSRNEASGSFRLGLHIWPNDKPALVARTIGAHLDPQKLAGVTPADMAGIAGCDVLFTPRDSGFEGAMVKGACAFDAPNGKPIYSWSQMTITATQFGYLDGWFSPDGAPFIRFPGEWYAFDKRR